MLTWNNQLDFNKIFQPIYKKNSKISSSLLYKKLTQTLSKPLNKYIYIIGIINIIQPSIIVGILVRLYIFFTNCTGIKTMNELLIEKIYTDIILWLMIALLLICVLFQYFINDYLYMLQVKYINQLKFYIIYDLLPKISHTYIVSNATNISQINNKLIYLSEQYLSFNIDSNLLLLILTIIIYVIISLLLLLLLINILPFFIHRLQWIIRTEDNIILETQLFNEKIISKISIYGIIISVIFFLLIFLYHRIQNNTSKVNITGLILNTNNIHDDILLNHSTYIDYNANTNSFLSLMRYYSLLLINQVQNSSKHLPFVYLLYIPVCLYFFIILIQYKDIYKEIQATYSTINKIDNDNLQKLLFLIFIGVISILVLVFISINNFFAIVNINIINKKNLYINKNQLESLFNEFINMPFEQIKINNKTNNISDNINIKFDKVSLSFSNNIIFQDVSFQLESGNHYFVVGASGSGKSTLFNIILQFIINIQGNVYLKDKNIFHKDNQDRLNYVAYMPQGIKLETQNLYKNIKYKYHIIDEDIYSQIIKIIDNICDKRTQIRIGCLLYDLFTHPDVFIIILDEPFAGISHEDAYELADIIKKYIYSSKVTVLNSDHTEYTLSLLTPKQLLYFGNLNENTTDYISLLNIDDARKNQHISKNIPGIHLK